MQHDELLKPYVGGKDSVEYRFMFNCCADALPLGRVLC